MCQTSWKYNNFPSIWLNTNYLPYGTGAGWWNWPLLCGAVRECVCVCVCLCETLGFFVLSEHFSILFTVRLQTWNVMQRKRQVWHTCKFPGHHQSVGVLTGDSAPERLLDQLPNCRQQLISKVLFTLKKKPETTKPQPSPPRNKCHYVQLLQFSLPPPPCSVVHWQLPLNWDFLYSCTACYHLNIIVQ